MSRACFLPIGYALMLVCLCVLSQRPAGVHCQAKDAWLLRMLFLSHSSVQLLFSYVKPLNCQQDALVGLT